MTGLSYCKIIVDLKSLISDHYNINDRLAQLLSDISGGKLLPCSPSEKYSDLMSKKDVDWTFLNHPSLSQHHLKSAEINNLIMVLMHMVCSQPSHAWICTYKMDIDTKYFHSFWDIWRVVATTHWKSNWPLIFISIRKSNHCIMTLSMSKGASIVTTNQLFKAMFETKRCCGVSLRK